MKTDKPEVVAYRYTASRSFGKRNRKWHYQESFPHASNREVAEIGQFEELIRLSDYQRLQADHERLQAEGDKLRKDAERYRSLLEAVQGEPVGYVSPRLLKSLLSGKACGITMEDKPDAHNGVTIPLYTASPAVQMEVVGWQFYEDGKWWNGDDRIKDHKRNTQEAGYRIRDVYAITGQS